MGISTPGAALRGPLAWPRECRCPPALPPCLLTCIHAMRCPAATRLPPHLPACCLQAADATRPAAALHRAVLFCSVAHEKAVGPWGGLHEGSRRLTRIITCAGAVAGASCYCTNAVLRAALLCLLVVHSYPSNLHCFALLAGWPVSRSHVRSTGGAPVAGSHDLCRGAAWQG